MSRVSEVVGALENSKGGRPYVQEDREAILAGLRQGETIASAARRGGIGETAFRNRLAADAGFAAQVDAARTEGRQRRADELAEVLFQGASKAAEDPRFTGQLIFALTNLDPRHWRNTQYTTADVAFDGPLPITVTVGLAPEAGPAKLPAGIGGIEGGDS